MDLSGNHQEKKQAYNKAVQDMDYLQLWLKVVEQTMVPANGNTFTNTEKDTLARCCHALANAAQSIEKKMTN